MSVWKDETYKSRILFVVNTISESLFDYSSDSAKIPALNLHFLCKEYLMTHNSWEEGAISKGNLYPLIEELEWSIKNNELSNEKIQVAFQQFYDANGNLNEVPNDFDFKIKHYKSYVEYLVELFETNDFYLKVIRQKILDCIFNSNWDEKDKHICYCCVRDLLVELISCGVSKASLYYKTETFFDPVRQLKGTKEELETFFDSLLPQTKQYDVIIGLSERAYKILNPFAKHIRKAQPIEALRLKCRYVMEFSKVNACDATSAMLGEKGFIRSLLSAINFNQHNIDVEIAKSGFVRRAGEEYFSYIKDPVNSLIKNQNKTTEENKRFVSTFIDNISDISEMLKVFELHDSALSYKENTNQLLNLWTIIEILIEMPQDSMDKINHICNVLIPILNQKYLLDLIVKLYKDINKVVKINDIVKQQIKGNNQIEKFVFIMFEKGQAYNDILDRLNGYDLYIYRLKMYAEEVFISSERLFVFMEKHSARLRWQIMRIYRNRCMIVHNGENMPYIDTILENLHYYVDVLIGNLFDYYKKGMFYNESIYQEARVLSICRKNLLVKEEKKKIQYLTLDADNLIKYIFNKF